MKVEKVGKNKYKRNNTDETVFVLCMLVIFFLSLAAVVNAVLSM